MSIVTNFQAVPSRLLSVYAAVAEAENGAERALTIRRKSLGDGHPDTAAAAFLLARSRIGQEKHAGALELLELAAERDERQDLGLAGSEPVER